MRGHDTDFVFEKYLNLVKDSPGTVNVLRKLQKRHGANAALDALLLVLIKRSQHQTSAFSYGDTMRHFCDEYPRAIPLLDQAVSTFSREVIRRTLRE